MKPKNPDRSELHIAVSFRNASERDAILAHLNSTLIPRGVYVRELLLAAIRDANNTKPPQS